MVMMVVMCIGMVGVFAVQWLWEQLRAAGWCRKRNASGFSEGQSVVISGLKSEAHLNGKTAICSSWDPSAGRWLVAFEDGDKKGVRPENLLPSVGKHVGSGSSECSTAPSTPCDSPRGEGATVGEAKDKHA